MPAGAGIAWTWILARRSPRRRATCSPTPAVTRGVTGGLVPAGVVTRYDAPSTAGVVVENAPSAAGVAVPAAIQPPPGAERSTPSRAVPAGARPEGVSGSPAIAPSGATESVAATTLRFPVMNACSVQTNGYS